MAETPGSIRIGLLDWTRRERAGWELLLTETGEARFATPGAMGDWTFLDLISHLTAWQQFEQAPLEAAVDGQTPEPPWPTRFNPRQDQDAINDFIHERTRASSTMEVIRVGRETWDRLERALAAAPDALLLGPAPDAEMGAEPFGPAILRWATGHFHQDHEMDLRVWLAGFGVRSGDQTVVKSVN